MLGRPTLKDIVNRLQGEYTQPYLPLIETVPSQDGEERLRIAGMAIFRDGKLLDTLSIDQTRGVLWATDELSRAIVTVDFGEQNRSRVSVELEESKSTMQVSLRDGKPVLRLSIRIEAGIKEVLSETGGGVEIDQLPQIQNAVSARIKSTVEEVVDQVFFSQKSDIFRYSEFIRKELWIIGSSTTRILSRWWRNAPLRLMSNASSTTQAWRQVTHRRIASHLCWKKCRQCGTIKRQEKEDVTGKEDCT